MAEHTVIFGAGGHGKVVAETARMAGITVSWIVDDAESVKELVGVPVVGSGQREWKQLSRFEFVVAIGDNETRARKFSELVEKGGTPVNVVHPAATISNSARLGGGIVVFAGVVVNAGAELGDNCIINTCASIDHDCVIGPHVHLCPGVHLAGAVSVGTRSFIGTGAVVLPGIKMGQDCVIGAGAVVNRHVPDGAVAYGVPARLHRKHTHP